MSGIIFDWKDATETEFGVTKIPNRKNPALYVRRGAMLDILAYFRDTECADRFMNTLEYIAERTNKTTKEEN